MAGRRTLCTPERVEKIVNVLRAGNYISTAAAYAGISETTYWNWHKRGENELDRMDDLGLNEPSEREAKYVEFLEVVTRARAAAEIETVTHIKKAVPEDWRAGAWFLERSYQDRWGRTKVEVEHNGDIELRLKVAKPAKLTGMTKDGGGDDE